MAETPKLLKQILERIRNDTDQALTLLNDAQETTRAWLEVYRMRARETFRETCFGRRCRAVSALQIRSVCA